MMDAYGNMTSGVPYTSTALEQTETIFIIDDNGNILPYVKVLERETSGLFGGKRTKNKFANKHLLENYTGVFYPQLEAFAKENDLNLKVKSHLLKILDHYFELLETQ